ncbi:MAG: hypothetical protein QXU18_02340 [Thermoplasmatales archaeon]
MIVVVKAKTRTTETPDLDKKIIAAEKNKIATLLVTVLEELIKHEFQFPFEQSLDDVT